MRRLINKLLRRSGYEIMRIRRPRVTVGGIRYEVNEYGVGPTPEGAAVAEGAIRMIRERGLTGLRVLDIGCGSGIIGLTIFSRLSDEGRIAEVVFTDINVFNLDSLHRTLRVNDLGHLMGNRLRSYLSDSLAHIPAEEKFDLIVSNAPHYPGEDLTAGPNALVPAGLATFDAGWRFHRSFYERCHLHLADGGEVWFLENAKVVTEDDFLPFIRANPRLRYAGQAVEPLNSRFFWMFTAAVPDPSPSESAAG